LYDNTFPWSRFMISSFTATAPFRAWRLPTVQTIQPGELTCLDSKDVGVNSGVAWDTDRNVMREGCKNCAAHVRLG
jgi:hypothetical protein